MANFALFDSSRLLFTRARSTAAHDRRRPGSRLAIVRTERVVWSELASERRARLAAELYAIFDELYAGFDLPTFEAHYLSRERLVVALFYGANGRLGGFCCCTITRVSTASRDHAVFSAGVYIGTRYKGGRRAALFGLGEALRFKLLHPSMPVGYLGFAHTPAPYRLFVRTMPRAYPSRPERSGEPPPEHVEVMREAVAARGWPSPGDDPWVVATPMRVRCAESLSVAASLYDDPDVRAFVERVPEWASKGHALATWMPLELRDIVGGALRSVGQ